MAMAPYNGAVLPLTSGPFPYVAVVTDQTGMVVKEIPVRSKADGEDMVIETIKELEKTAITKQEP
jgi:hypothetical protein